MNVPPVLKAAVLCIALAATPVAAQETTPSAGEILADLRQNSLSAEEILGVDAPGPVTVVSLEDFKGSDLQRLEEVLGGTEDGFAEVQTAIERNEALEIVGQRGDLPLGDLVAATRSETGEVTLYTNIPRR